MSIFKKRLTPAEKLHQAQCELIRKSGDYGMIPEVRETLTNGQLARIELEGDTSLVVLGKDEICVYLASASRTSAERALTGMSQVGESVDPLILNYRNRRVETSYASMEYTTQYKIATGLLVLTNKRLSFIPVGDEESGQLAFDIRLDDITSLRQTDNILLTVQHQGQVDQIYTKYPVLLIMAFEIIKKAGDDLTKEIRAKMTRPASTKTPTK